LYDLKRFFRKETEQRDLFAEICLMTCCGQYRMSCLFLFMALIEKKSLRADLTIFMGIIFKFTGLPVVDQ
jgi:hypothetical protein